MKPIEGVLGLLPTTWVFTVGTYFVNLFLEVFYTEIEFIFLLMVAIIADLATAVIGQKVRKNPLTSLGLRQTIIKTIEYAIFLLILTGISNVFGNYDATDSGVLTKGVTFIFSDIHVLGFLLLIWTELISISENILDKDGGVKSIIDLVKDKLKIKK